MRSSSVGASCADRRGRRVVSTDRSPAYFRRGDHTAQVSNANQEIVAATQKNRRFLDTYWDLIEKIIGFGTGAAPPIDRRSAVSLTPMVIEL
eukprot:6972637-Prymnesium_polylepis.1